MKLILFFILNAFIFSQERYLKQLEFRTNVIFDTTPIRLEIIFNKKAKINNQWYQTGDKVSHFTIQAIHTHSITLQDKQGVKITLGFSKP